MHFFLQRENMFSSCFAKILILFINFTGPCVKDKWSNKGVIKTVLFYLPVFRGEWGGGGEKIDETNKTIGG